VLPAGYDDATLVIEPGRCVTGHVALRNAFVAIAEHFTHTLRVSQEEILVVEGAGTASCSRKRASAPH
jgi:ketosteroid isomerase-like protein